MISLKVIPRARRESIQCPPEGEAPGVLRVAVTAPPEDGKANAAVIALLAKTWDLPKSTFAVTAGASARQKRILVRGNAAELTRRILAATAPT
jgi:uncharacterized protein